MILITGSQGFIGSYLMQAIPGAIGIDNVNRKTKNGFIPVDIRDYNSLFWMIRDYKIDAVLHNAAIPSVPNSYKDPIKTYENNISASINLIKVCKILEIPKFIFASTSSVNGPSPYGHSKKVIEEVLEKSGLDYTVLRYFNVFGKGQRENVVSIMIKALQENLELCIYGDGTTTRDFSHVNNVVAANKKVLGGDYKGQILEVGTGESYSLLHLYKKLREKINPLHDKLRFCEERVGDLKYSNAKTFLQPHEITKSNEGLDLCL